jgi:DNA repair protein RadC
VVTAHNHPYGPFYPTPGDRETNTLVTEALAMAGVLHAEHYIVSGDSYAGMGSLKNFQSKLSQSTEVSEFMQASERSDGERFKVSSIDHASVDTDKLLFGGYTDCFDYFVRLLSYCEGKGAEQTARAVLSRYLTVENSFTASVGELKEICGEKCTAYLKLLAYVISRRETDKFKLGRSHNKREISDYLKALFLGESVEKIYLISFDGEGRTIAVNMLAEGTVNSSEITPRKAIETAIYASAASVSLAHNHPFGTTKPSSDDLALTKHFASLFATCDIGLSDHYIVAGQLCDTINIEL